GGVPAGQLVELCFSGKFTEKEIMKKICGNGGLKAYLGTNDALEVERLIGEGNKKAELVYKAIAYQTAKEIGAMSVVLRGKVDGILLSGGLAHSKIIIDEISEMVGHLGKVRVYPGENEMQALANYGYLILNNEIEVKEYL
ncbi:MAG: butyrate kinase, partial [Bacteroidota bacterium]